jgi:IS30 family transposase
MNNTKLTAADRKAIEVLLKCNFTPSEVARKVGFNKSSICRELKNNGSRIGYFAEYAQANSDYNRKRCRRKKILEYSKYRDYVLERLGLGWSPEQISGRLKNIERSFNVCPETIYSFIYTDLYCKENKVFQLLRFGRRKRRKKTGRKVQRIKIPNRVSIHKRPLVVSERTELGHWEGDSVIYANKYAINTLNELKTGIVVYTKLRQRTAELTISAMQEAFSTHPAKTLTLDNGMEFVRHEELKARNVEVYFADPYSSWQRGSNENSNMLLRGYLPKRANIDELTQEDLDSIAEDLNNRPRKRLGYRTPAEVYKQELDILFNSCNRS